MASSGAQGLFTVDLNQLQDPPEEALFAGIQFTRPSTPAGVDAPVEFTNKVLSRVFKATRYIFGHKIRAMALPIINSGIQVHEAHCVGLGAFRQVQHYHFDEADTEKGRIFNEVMERANYDENIRAMIRYSVMLIFFTFLTFNGATGYGINNGRGFTVYMTDPRIHVEEMAIIRNQSKEIPDMKNGVMVNVHFKATNWTNDPPILTHSPQHCACQNPYVNHFLYVADHDWANLNPGVCRMPEKPVFLLAMDWYEDEKHTQGCVRITHETPSIVPLGTGAIDVLPVTVLPHFMRHERGYLKYCLDGTEPSPVNMTEIQGDLLPFSGCLFLRRDRVPFATYGLDFF